MYGIIDCLQFVNEIFAEIGQRSILENDFFQEDEMNHYGRYLKFFHNSDNLYDMYIGLIFTPYGIQIDIDNIDEAVCLSCRSIRNFPKENKELIKHIFTSYILVEQHRFCLTKFRLFNSNGDVFTTIRCLKLFCRYRKHVKLYKPIWAFSENGNSLLFRKSE